MKNFKTLIADNSSTYRKMFTAAVKAVNSDADVLSVTDCGMAVGQVVRKSFDVVIIDAELPGMDLTELLNVIISNVPKAFILVTARPSAVKTKILLETLSNGASECMIKPIHDTYEENLEAIRCKLSDIIKQLKTEAQCEEKAEEIIHHECDYNNFEPEIILIASSTGGPRALEAVIPKLRGDLPVPILLVQHITPPFIETLAQRLDSLSALKVKVAEESEIIKAGTVYVAPGKVHTKLNEKNKILYDNSHPLNGVRPAADVLFESVAESFDGKNVLAVILTGMGSDGKNGIARLKEKKNCVCIIQNEKTCVVYGMPKAAETYADKILNLADIAGGIESYFGKGRK
ncbi:MAG: response regulator [Oscillospiraceae bacterium]|nr:response regulator [Oscillospiraceae bacterium]